MSNADRTTRRYALIFKKNAGEMTEAEQAELAELQAWWQKTIYGTAQEPEGTVSRSAGQGGPIYGDGDDMMEPMQIEAHEGEYVVRPEAVDAVGVDALDQLNSMGMNPGMAQGSGMSESFFDKLAMEQTDGGGMMVTMRDQPREKSGIAALDALTERPERRGRGILHSRQLGRVMGG